MRIDPSIHEILQNGIAIPAHPLALDERRKLDERRQRALSRYYIDAGAGGLAVGVHTTQFAIHDPQVGLYEPVLTIAAEEMHRADATPNMLRTKSGLFKAQVSWVQKFQRISSSTIRKRCILFVFRVIQVPIGYTRPITTAKIGMAVLNRHDQ